MRCEECSNWFARGLNAAKTPEERAAFIAGAKAAPVYSPGGGYSTATPCDGRGAQ